LKIDKHVRDLSRRLDTLCGSGNNDEDDSYILYEHDDDYYLDIGIGMNQAFSREMHHQTSI
jgi:hypothetical protein